MIIINNNNKIRRRYDDDNEWIYGGSNALSFQDLTKLRKIAVEEGERTNSHLMKESGRSRHRKYFELV